MTILPWYFDVLSPFAYLQLESLRRDHPEVRLQPHPVVLGAVLAHHGQLGPAEISGKRQFTYRFVIWRAQELRIPLRFPPRHPFNPLAALRLIIAAGGSVDVVQCVFRHIWAQGQGCEAPAELETLAAGLGIDDVAAAISSVEVKVALKHSTEQALVQGVFGVPTLLVHGQPYFGQDATGLALAALENPQMLQQGEYARLAGIPMGVQRARPTV